MEREEIVQRLAVAVPIILRGWLGRIDTCVAGTRIAHDVCTHFGIPNEPVPVFAAALNQVGVDWLAHGRGREMNGDEFEAAGGWCVGIDLETEAPGRYPAHLVLALPGDPNILLDTTAGQFARPARGIDFADGIATVAPQGFLDRTCNAVLRFDEPPCALVWERIEPKRSFRHGHDWRDRRTEHRQIVGRLIRQLRSAA